MDVMTLGLLAGALLMAIGAGLVFMAAARCGQFDERDRKPAEAGEFIPR